MSLRTLSETFSLNFNENQTLAQMIKRHARDGLTLCPHSLVPSIIVFGSHWAFVVVVTAVVDFDGDGGEKSVGRR